MVNGIIGSPILSMVLREDTGVKDDIQTGFEKGEWVRAMWISGDRVWHVDEWPGDWSGLRMRMESKVVVRDEGDRYEVGDWVTRAIIFKPLI